MKVRTKGTLLLAFVLAIGAGVVLGLAASGRIGRAAPPPAVPTPTPATSIAATRPAERSWMVEQLGLDPEQSREIREIWEGLMQGPGRNNSERRRALEKDREEAILRLFTSEQLEQRRQLMAQYDAQVAELNRERDRLGQEAVERTKKVLTEPQRVKYEELLKERERAGRGHRRGGPATTRSTTAPATQPVTRPSD